MTDEPQEAATTELVAGAAGDGSTGTEVAGAIDDARQEVEQIRLAQDALWETVEEVQAILDGATSLTTTSGDLFAEFKQAAKILATARQELEREKAALVAREQAIFQAEQQRDEGFADQRATVERELAERRASALTALEAELAEARYTHLAEVAASESAERDRIRAEIAMERADWDELRNQQQQDLRQQRDEVEKQKGAVSALQSELEGKRVALDNEELDLEGRTLGLKRQIQKRRDNLDEDVAVLLSEERKSFESSLKAASDENDRLRESLRSQQELLGDYALLQQQLDGIEPMSVLADLKAQNQLLSHQREAMVNELPDEVRAQLDVLEDEKRTLANRIDQLKRDLARNQALVAESKDLKLRNSNLEAANKSLERKAKIYEGAANEAETELNRLRAAYERPAEVDARYGEIEMPRFKFEDINLSTQADVSESEWLRGVAQQCDEYGLHFDARILKAFHTSLKTAEMSPLTVLAGVSGTGKSELPRLYSHFGGLYFEPLSVQPNWDSQESMLGFFNSIDNRFDAQPVLRFLAQSQKQWQEGTDEFDGYPGLIDAVCLVLLDEMNLAHPELYFAEFLSKLEQRRGKKGADVPTLPVKIGSGMEPYQLSLGRNLLWAGTMNQDETTKSLSDKVLDRANVILFPRPTDLVRRRKLTALDVKNRGPELPVKTWQRWLSVETSFTDAEFKPFKSFLEEMNTSLAVAGRAIGHRVLQSVEFYMSNYPDVREAGEDSVKKAQAMHVAFEDQLAQKVMPKLRGIDTRGKSKEECLDPIRGQLVAGVGGNGFNLAEDFDLAMDLGYGQFIWQSATYVKADAPDDAE